MHETVVIGAGDLRAEIVPSLGAALARFDLIDGGARLALFRPWPEEGSDDPTQLACNLLVPWSNRISGGGFKFDGRFYPLEAEFAGDPFPLHGNGWVSKWTLRDHAPSRAVLDLDAAGSGAYSYSSRVEYELDPSALTIRLTVESCSATALPFGLGLHPWLPRGTATGLRAKAETVWLEDERHLPTGSLGVRARPDWDFAAPRPLPASWINNAFTGWDRHASVEWPERRLALTIEASERLETYLLYSPSADSPFFCFEPVSHPVDAHNLPGGPAANGLVVLAPGERLSVHCRFAPRRL
ncbi:MAG: aldose 1-epimerase [Rhizobiales bacterium]|nr:aldose 1-epimerase [Hyphomicrobiales bacterium]